MERVLVQHMVLGFPHMELVLVPHMVQEFQHMERVLVPHMVQEFQHMERVLVPHMVQELGHMVRMLGCMVLAHCMIESSVSGMMQVGCMVPRTQMQALQYNKIIIYTCKSM